MTENMISIRIAQSTDAERILQIEMAAWFITYPNETLGLSLRVIKSRYTPENLAKRLIMWKRLLSTTDTDKLILVAELDNKVVGYINLKKADGIGSIDLLYIDPEFQGKGVGRKLMRSGMKWLIDCVQLKVCVTAYNEKAIGFYDHFGFEKNDNSVEPFMVGDVPMPIIEMVRTN